MIREGVTLKTDYVFDAKLSFGWLLGTYEKEFLLTIKTIYDEVNYNESKLNSVGFLETYPMELFFTVFNTYGNTVMSRKELLEYDGQKGDNDNNNKLIVNAVSRNSSINADLVNRILKQLFWSTEAGRVLSGKWIRPRTYMETQGYRELRSDAKGSDWLQKLMWIAILIGVSIGGFYVFKAYAAYKSTKFLTTGKM